MITRRLMILTMASGAAMAWLAAGCSQNSSSMSDDPTTRALSDPMGYLPTHDNEDISGGDLTNFDSDAFKKDMDHVLNP